MDRMNRKWIVSGSREEYVTGVKEFLEFAFRNDINGKVPCPCTKCVNHFYRGKDEMFDHLVMNRMMQSYDTGIVMESHYRQQLHKVICMRFKNLVLTVRIMVQKI